jgi:hypothetical protein
VFPVSDVAGDYESFFLDATPNGNDVFFATEDQLVPSDTDFHVDVYDARVDGGFPVSVAPAACENGDSCEGPVALQPSVFGAPASATFSGAGNLAPVVKPVVKPKPKLKAKCKKGFVRKHAKCVKKKTGRAGRSSSRSDRKAK